MNKSCGLLAPLGQMQRLFSAVAVAVLAYMFVCVAHTQCPAGDTRRAVGESDARNLISSVCHYRFPVGANGGVSSWRPPFVPGEVLVRFKASARESQIEELRERIGAVFCRKKPFADFVKMKVSNDRLGAVIEFLRNSGLVEYAEPNYVRRICGWTPNDPYFDLQWNMKNPPEEGGINMPEAWAKAPGGGKGVIVAIVDTGVAYENRGVYRKAPDLSGTRFIQGYDFVNEDPYADDDHGHGTHVCGTVAQTTNNSYGVAGVAFGASIMPLKAMDKDGFGVDEDIAPAIRLAAQKGAAVINLSFAGPSPSSVLKSAIDYAVSKGAVLCASSGNEGEGTVMYPAAYDECIAVGASTRSAEVASYSNWGSKLDLVAPGGEGLAKNMIIQNTYRTAGDPSSGFAFVAMSGTSMASAHAAGVAALVRALKPSFTREQVRAALISSCRDIGVPGWDARSGYGLLDASGALGPEAEPKVVVESVSPETARGGTKKLLAQIRGRGFHQPVKVVLKREGQAGISGKKVYAKSLTEVECEFDLSSALPGLYELEVENSLGDKGRLEGALYLLSPNNRVWYLAEGCTKYGFEEYILLQNPGDEDAFVAVTFMTPEGAKDPYPVELPARSRKTLRVNDILPDQEVSARIESDKPILCERAMYWEGRLEGTDSTGIESPSSSWYFAEGCTAYGYETYILIQNPSAEDASVEVTYLTPAGKVKRAPIRIGGGKRYTLDVSSDIPSGEMSVCITADRGVVAERAMYWDVRRGGHVSGGTTGTCRKWYLAEGSTNWGFEEYLLLGNPTEKKATVRVTAFQEGKSRTLQPMEIPSGSRITLRMSDYLPGSDIAAMVTADRGVVAERAMYWLTPTGKAGHAAAASPRAANKWALSEGSTAWGFETWVLVVNPGDETAKVTLSYQGASGPAGSRSVNVPPRSRLTVDVARDAPGLDLSTFVSSTDPVVVERAMYWYGRGGGHVSPGKIWALSGR